MKDSTKLVAVRPRLIVGGALLMSAVAAAIGYGAYHWSAAAVGHRSASGVAVADGPDEVELPAAEAVDQAEFEDAMSRCDRLGGDPDDPDRAREIDDSQSAGVVSRDLDLAGVLAACAAGDIRTGQPKEQLRVQYQRTRALLQGGQFEAAVKGLRSLCKADYGAACLRMAVITKNGSADVPQDDFAAMGYARQAVRLNVAVAGDLILELSPLVNPGSRLQGRGLVEPMIRGEFDVIPDTVGTRRYMYTLFMQSERQHAQWYVGQMSNQDHLNARRMILPIAEERLKLTGKEAGELFKRTKEEVAEPSDWRGKAVAAAKGWMGGVTLVRNVNSLQIAVAAQDAQKLFEWFSGCGSCTARGAYQRNMSALLKRWAARTPRADDQTSCALLQGAGPDCRLDDYEGAEGGRTIDILSRSPAR